METGTEFIKADFADGTALHVQARVAGPENSTAFIFPAFHELNSLSADIAVSLATHSQHQAQPTGIDIDFHLPLSLDDREDLPSIILSSSAKAISSRDAESGAKEHLQRCTVRISTTTGNYTGFFIGPGQILTGNAVIHDQGHNSSVTVHWNNASYVAQTLVDLSQVDAALLYVDIEDHPCASLNTAIERFDDLCSYAFLKNYPQGYLFIVRYYGVTSQDRYLRLSSAEAGQGSQGAPLLNLRTGQICGIIGPSPGRTALADEVLGTGIQAILQELSKHSYRLPQPQKVDSARARQQQYESQYIRQQFARDIGTYAAYVENSLRHLNLSGILPEGSVRDPEIGSLYVSPDISEGEAVVDIITALDNHIALVLSGEPGSGKSTLVRYLAWSHTLAYTGTYTRILPPLLEAGLSLPENLPRAGPLPLRIELRSLVADRRQFPGYSFLSYATEVLLGREGVHISQQMFELLLERRMLLLLFDGLDEVASLSERQQLVEEIEQFVHRYPGNHVLVTSRPSGYEQTKFRDGFFSHAHLLPLNNEQIERFIKDWYFHVFNSLPLPDGEQQESENLLAIVRTHPRLHALAANPLYLTIIVLLPRSERLPDRRVLIYDRIADLWLDTWSKLKGTDVRWRDLKISKYDRFACVAHLGFSLLQRLQPQRNGDGQERTAYVGNGISLGAMLQEIERFFDEQKLYTDESERRAQAAIFLNLISVEAGLIIEQGFDESGEVLYGFANRTLQEYFAAVDVYERYQEEETLDVIRAFLRQNLLDSYWREVILLLFEKLKTKPRTTLLRDILSGAIRSQHDVGSRLSEAEQEIGVRRDQESLLARQAESDTLALLREDMGRPAEMDIIFDPAGRKIVKAGDIVRPKDLETLERMAEILRNDIAENARRELEELRGVGENSRLDNLLFVSSCMCEELVIDDVLAEEVFDALELYLVQGGSLSRYTQAWQSLNALARTRLYGKSARSKIENEQKRRQQLAGKFRGLLNLQSEILLDQRSDIAQLQRALEAQDQIYQKQEQLTKQLQDLGDQEAITKQLQNLQEMQSQVLQNQTQVVYGLEHLLTVRIKAYEQQEQLTGLLQGFWRQQWVTTRLPVQQLLKQIEMELQSLAEMQLQSHEELKMLFKQLALQWHHGRTAEQLRILLARGLEHRSLQKQAAKIFYDLLATRASNISLTQLQINQLQEQLAEQLEKEEWQQELIEKQLQGISSQTGQLYQQEQQLVAELQQLLNMQTEVQQQQRLAVKPLEEFLAGLADGYQQAEPPSVQRIPVYHYYLFLEVAELATVQIGQTLTLHLQISATRQENSVLLSLPANAMELGIYLEAPGFYLEGDHVRSLPVVNGRPAALTLEIRCTPVLSGERMVRVLVYPGGQVQGLTPGVLTHTFTVMVPVVLPEIPELIDYRAIPDPQPDILLILALDERKRTQQLQIYCTCPALKMEREPLPPLSLTLDDISALRQTVTQCASGLRSLAPYEVEGSLQRLGALLFDQLMPPDHQLRSVYWQFRKLAVDSSRPWSWLIIADEFALLPWELVCPYDTLPDTGEFEYDDFLADSFILAQWVARQGLPLQAEAPLGWLALDHYHQHPHRLPQWHTVLSDEPPSTSGQAVEGYQVLQQPALPYYGLHILRYNTRGMMTRITTHVEQESQTRPSQREAEGMTYERRLDFTRKRPVIGLSLVEEEALQHNKWNSRHDTRLEDGWLLPFMHAGASALVGPRWPVSPEVDQLFFLTFYQAIRRRAPLGWAVGVARAQVKRAFPWCADWLAYVYFGHPLSSLYEVQPAQGFTLFEVLHHPEDAPFACGETYQFLASYRTEAPLWYEGRVQIQRELLQGEDVSVMVIPLSGTAAQTYPLQRIADGNDYQCIVDLTMPREESTYSIMVRFQRGKKELQTFILHLDVEEQRRDGML